MIPFKGDDVTEFYYGECYFGKNTEKDIEFKLPFTPKAVAVEFQWVTPSSWGEGWNVSGYVTSLQERTAPVAYVKTTLTEDSVIVTRRTNYVGNVWFAAFDKPVFDK